MARLFVAVWPPEHVVEEMMALRRKDQRGVRFVPPEQWHVTLRFLGDADTGEVAAALDAMRADATEAVLGPAVDVIGEHTLVLPVQGLDALAAEVIHLTRGLGTAEDRRRFLGHLTVARVKQRRAPMPAVLGALFEASFPVHEVTLVESRLRAEGPRYDVVASWSLPRG